MSQALEIRGLSHSYPPRTVLEDIEFSVPAGRTVALVGPSGCGKTTLLHLCAGLLSVQKGALGNPFVRPAVMFQQPRLLPWKTTQDNIALGLQALGVPVVERLDRVKALAVAVGIILWQTHEDQVGADYYDSLRGTAAETELML